MNNALSKVLNLLALISNEEESHTVWSGFNRLGSTGGN